MSQVAQPPDLVVAGAGGGLVAAVRAAQLGSSVLVVEASEHSGRANNTAMSTAMIPGAGSRWQRAAGVDDSPECLVADVLAKTDGQADVELTRALAQVSARLVGWLADDVGLRLDLVTDFPYPGHSRYRCHSVPGRSGRSLVAALRSAVHAASGVDLLVPARLTGVVTEAGRVAAAELSYPDGRQEQVPCGAVLLATGGFAADADLVARHVPEIAGATYHGSDQARGDALRIGTALGADTTYLDAYQGHAALALPAATLVGWATVMHGAFLVNAHGERFGDETEGYSEFARRVLAQPDSRAVVVLDRRIHDACLLFDDFRDTVTSGALRWADDVGHLAQVSGVDPDGLRRTFAEVAAAAAGRASDRFDRAGWGPTLAPPFAAVTVAPALFHTQGGLRVDGHGRVLTPDRRAIPGLYAAGGAAAGVSGHGAAGYLAGNGLLAALGLAFLAAEHAAAARARAPANGVE